jgi:hypothetical protein
VTEIRNINKILHFAKAL